ncbi:hypothetical protein [Agaribacter flavus]|uniref:Uncharacterized protein n=1 Tax=Agaribacter flavus TaxID=1902781 RepID=A0ABV7FTC3_9ALTE
MSVSSLVYIAHGEKVIPGAKTVDIGNDTQHLPQHYITYHHNLKSVEEILSKISFSDEILLFSGINDNGLYIQVGVIGEENYQLGNHEYPPKIVYGRKWRIDSDTPSSEIIQTTMLAIKKVREHEVRELFTWTDNRLAIKSAPLSCHQDINMLKKAASIEPTALPSEQNTELDTQVRKRIRPLRFLGRKILIHNVVTIDSTRFLFEFIIEKQPLTTNSNDEQFKEYSTFEASLVLDQNNISSLEYMLLDTLIAHSDRYVEENFVFDSFRRFSRAHSFTWIAEQSRKSRPYKKHLANEKFKATFEKTNYKTDQIRKPDLGEGLLAELNVKKLSAHPNITGHLPKGYKKNLVKSA